MRAPHVRTPFQALRAALVAATILVLAAGAHLLAGGQLPAPGILAAFLALTGLVSTAATRLKLNLATMTGLVGTGQVLLHEALSAFSPPSARAFAGGSTTAAHHPGLSVIALPADHLQLSGPDSALALSMLAGHALATLACALLLAKGEDALWSLAAWLRPLIQLPALPAQPPAAAPSMPRSDASLPLPRRNLRHDCRRGPPAVVVFS